MLSYVTVDVFSATRFGGNQLAVVLDAGDLDDTLMQAIALEFSYAETTFVRPPADPSNTAEVRIFTPRTELPFAGHPNVGTAFALARLGGVFGKPISDTVYFEEKAGLVPVEIQREDGVPVGARLTSPQAFARSDPVAADVIAACCGISPAEIDGNAHEPCIASCAIPWVFARATDAEAVVRARPNPAAFAKLLPTDIAAGIELYTPVPGTGPGDSGYKARVFVPGFGIIEDAATGSANVTLAGLLADIRPETDMQFVTSIRQGDELDRPSLLVAEADKENGAVTATRIGGRCVQVMEGKLALG